MTPPKKSFSPREIIPAANGYVVSPSARIDRGPFAEWSEVHVFRTLFEAYEFLEDLEAEASGVARPKKESKPAKPDPPVPFPWEGI